MKYHLLLLIVMVFVGTGWGQVPADSVQTDSLRYLTDEDLVLKEVQVTAKRPLFERQLDKMVFHVSQSPLAAGTNGKELLKKAPGILIDKDGNVTYNGKSVEVYIDGRPSYLSGEQLRAMLEGIDGSTIDKIELLSTPGAKYDANGTGGIIDIKMKRNKMKGLNGILNASYGGMYFKDVNRYVNQDFVGLNLNYRANHTYTYFQFNQVFSNQSITAVTTMQMPWMNRKTTSAYGMDFQYYMLKFGNDWYIDSANTLGFFVQTPTMLLHQIAPSDKGGSTTAYYNVAGICDSILHATTMQNNATQAPQHTANVNFTHVFSDDLERELTVNIDYNRYNSQSSNKQYNTVCVEEPPLAAAYRGSGLHLHTRQLSNICSAKLDFQTKFWQTGMIETGCKYIVSTMQSRMLTDSLQQTSDDEAVKAWNTRASTRSDFDYAEHVSSFYISLAKQFGKHWHVKVGLRGEYTYSKGNWLTADSISTKSYFNLFPTVQVSYVSNPLGRLQQTVSVSAGYNRRIKRPNYYILNPFITYIDAYNYSIGNTELTPEFNNDVEVNVSYSQYMSVTFNFSHTQDMFSQQNTILPNGSVQAKWHNFGTCTTHGFTVALTELPVVPKWDSDRTLHGAWLALTVNAGYFNFLNQSYAKQENGQPVYRNQNHYFRLNSMLNAYLPKDWSLSIDGWYSAPITIGYTRHHEAYGMNIGVRKAFNDKGLILNLQVQDLLRSACYAETAYGLPEGQSTSFCTTTHQQRVSLTLTYMFGHQERHPSRKIGDSEFNNRLGSGQTIGQ